MPRCRDEDDDQDRALRSSLSQLSKEQIAFLERFLDGTIEQRQLVRRVLEIDPNRAATSEHLSEILGAAADSWACWSGFVSVYSRDAQKTEATRRIITTLFNAGVEVEPRSDFDAISEWLNQLMDELVRSIKLHADRGWRLPEGILLITAVANSRRKTRATEQLRIDDDDYARFVFMRRRVYRARCFSIHAIAQALEIGPLEAARIKRRAYHRRLTDQQVAALLGMSVEEILTLLTPTPSALTLNALYDRTGYLDRRVRRDCPTEEPEGASPVKGTTATLRIAGGTLGSGQKIITAHDIKHINMADIFATLILKCKTDKPDAE
ncbi:MAG: hypothetical protein AAB417_00465 [Patescibacteria group bacterium]